jgi:hypothetical protein
VWICEDYIYGWKVFLGQAREEVRGFKLKKDRA